MPGSTLSSTTKRRVTHEMITMPEHREASETKRCLAPPSPRVPRSYAMTRTVVAPPSSRRTWKVELGVVPDCAGAHSRDIRWSGRVALGFTTGRPRNCAPSRVRPRAATVRKSRDAVELRLGYDLVTPGAPGFRAYARATRPEPTEPRSTPPEMQRSLDFASSRASRLG